ncbi:MAG: hypothetical protein FD167_5309, partial [bacterium]
MSQLYQEDKDIKLPKEALTQVEER